MLDLFKSLMGRKFCSWCNRGELGPWDRLEDRWHRHGGWRKKFIVTETKFWTDWVPTWKIGSWWHRKFHY